MRVRLRTWSRTSSGAATIVLWSCCRGRPAPLDRGLASRAQHPQGLHRADAVLGHLDSTSRASRLGRRDRIECVVFSPSSSRGPVGTGHLEDGHSGQRQVPGDAGAVAAGGLDPHAQQLAVRPEPGKHRSVSGSCRGERFGAEYHAFKRHNGGGVQILVGVDATDDPGCPHLAYSPCRPPLSMMGERVGTELGRCRTRQ